MSVDLLPCRCGPRIIRWLPRRARPPVPRRLATASTAASGSPAFCRHGAGSECVGQRLHLQLPAQFFRTRGALDPDLHRLARDQVEIVVRRPRVELAEGDVHAARQHLRAEAQPASIRARRDRGFNRCGRQMDLMGRDQVNEVGRDRRSPCGQICRDKDLGEIDALGLEG